VEGAVTAPAPGFGVYDEGRGPLAAGAEEEDGVRWLTTGAGVDEAAPLLAAGAVVAEEALLPAADAGAGDGVFPLAAGAADGAAAAPALEAVGEEPPWVAACPVSLTTGPGPLLSGATGAALPPTKGPGSEEWEFAR
jgi:hypothetical protein